MGIDSQGWKASTNAELLNGKKITGFFGFFDILGYTEFIEHNDLDRQIEIYEKHMMMLHEIAITLNKRDPEQYLSMNKTKSLRFSDTIILYQRETLKGPALGTSFILKAALLLRIAFEQGIPIRGAISYGDYFIHDQCVLGKPVTEAYKTEKCQNWSGTILCESASKIYEEEQEGLKKHPMMNYRGIPIDPTSFFSRFNKDFIILYKVPLVDKDGNEYREKKYALCWDDYLPTYIGIDIPLLNTDKQHDEIVDRIRMKFSAHKKLIDNNINIEQKIKNTADFISYIVSQPVSSPQLICYR
jgi:hypothetical protein